MDIASCIAVVHYFSDFITFRVTVDTTFDEFKEIVCAQWKQFTPLGISFFHRESGKDLPVDCTYSLQALTSLTHTKKQTSFDLYLHNVKHVASSSSRASSSVTCDSTESVRYSEVVTNFLENGKLPRKTLLSDGWTSALGKTGHVFVGGIKQVRDAFTKYRLRSGFVMIVTHNEPSRFTAKCQDENCLWHFHAAALDDDFLIFQVKKFISEHTCGVGGRDLNQKMGARFLSTLIEDEVRKNPHKKPNQIAADFATHYGINIEYYQAYNGRERVYKEIYGDDVMSYTHLVWYVDQIRKTNEGSFIDFQYDPVSRRFERIFIAFGACIQGYKFLRPVIYLDGTFLTGRFRGCLMAATAINGEKGFFPLAMALVPGEDVDNWDWFLRNLYQIVDHEARPITFLTDRGEGLKQGIPSIFPGSFHSFCYYHLKTNLPINGTDPRYSLVLDHFQEATYVYTPENHTKAIQKIRDLGCDWVADYIEAIPADKYANAFFKGCRYGRTASSLAESFNAWITVHKKMPASAFLDQVRMKVMVMMFDNREVGALMKTPLTTLYEEKLQSLSDEGLAWPVNRASTTIYEVLSDESSHTVNLENRTCTCQRWRVYGFPCSHALAAMRKGRCDVHEYIEPYFTSEYYRNSYSNVIHPIPTYNRPNDVPEADRINVPIVRKPPGRPKSKRAIGWGERNQTKKRKITCSNCKQLGHNRQGCREPAKFTP